MVVFRLAVELRPGGEMLTRAVMLMAVFWDWHCVIIAN